MRKSIAASLVGVGVILGLGGFFITPSPRGRTSQTVVDQPYQYTPPKLLVFSKANCGPCRRAYPIHRSIAAQGLAEVVVIRLESKPELCVEYNIQSYPTFILERDGKIQWRTVLPSDLILFADHERSLQRKYKWTQ